MSNKLFIDNTNETYNQLKRYHKAIANGRNPNSFSRYVRIWKTMYIIINN